MTPFPGLFLSLFEDNKFVKNIVSKEVEKQLPVLIALTELPNSDVENSFPLNAHLYSVLSFLQQPYVFPLARAVMQRLTTIQIAKKAPMLKICNVPIPIWT